MKNKNFINIQGWMINELNLKGNELILYALIYGFSQDGENKFKGSISYIMQALKISNRGAINLINKLIDKKLIEKSIKTTGNEYNAVVKKVHSEESSHVKKVHKQPVNKVPKSSEQSSHNNNRYKYNNNISTKVDKAKPTYGRPDINKTIEEIEKLISPLKLEGRGLRNYVKNMLDSKIVKILGEMGLENPTNEQKIAGILRIFQKATEDDFHRKKITNFPYIYNHVYEIINSSQSNNSNVTMI